MKKIFLFCFVLAFLTVGLFADVTVSTDGVTDFGTFAGMSKVCADYEIFDGMSVNAFVKAEYIPVVFSWGTGVAYAGSVFNLSADFTGDQDAIAKDVTVAGDITFGIVNVYGQTVLNFSEPVFGGMEAGVKTTLAGIDIVGGYWIGPGSAVNNPYETNAEGELFFTASYTF